MKICFATNNPKKIEEVKAALGDQFEIVSLRDIGCTEELPETGNTLDHNAFQKARFVKEKYGVDCFADDTGLEVEALDGQPGVYSGRYAGEPRSDAKNMEKLLLNLSGKQSRKAHFRTVIALILKGEEYAFEGIVSGQILQKGQGNGGFGYDPIFRPDGFQGSFAEMSMEQKNKISHRGRAVQQLSNFLKDL